MKNHLHELDIARALGPGARRCIQAPLEHFYLPHANKGEGRHHRDAQFIGHPDTRMMEVVAPRSATHSALGLAPRDVGASLLLGNVCPCWQWLTRTAWGRAFRVPVALGSPRSGPSPPAAPGQELVCDTVEGPRVGGGVVI